MTPIPQEVLDAGYKGAVHVEGWNPACVFFYFGTSPRGEHFLKTRKGKCYLVSNRLLYTRKNEPKK